MKNNRERAIEIADKAVGTYSNDLTKSIASSVIDALINEGLLLGKENKTQREFIICSNIKDKNGIETDWLLIWAEVENWFGDIGKKETCEEFLKRIQKTYPLLGKSGNEEIDWGKVALRDLMDTIALSFKESSDEPQVIRWAKLEDSLKEYLKSLSSSIVYPEKIHAGDEGYEEGYNDAIYKFKSLNSSRESETSHDLHYATNTLREVLNDFMAELITADEAMEKITKIGFKSK